MPTTRIQSQARPAAPQITVVGGRKRLRSSKPGKAISKASRNAKQRQSHRRILCKECKSFGFHATYENEKKYKRTLAEALQNPDCVLCNLLTDSSRPFTRRATRPENVECVLRLNHKQTTAPFSRVEFNIEQEYIQVEITVDSGSTPHLERLDSLWSRPPSRYNKQSNVVRHEVPESFDPKQLRAWLDISDQQPHISKWLEMQNRPLDAFLGSRRFKLIDVISKRMYTARKLPGYVALSYVWGSHPSRQISVSCHNGQIKWETLPRTIADAAELVKAIGERYLWVDVLCIDQRDEEHQAAIISQMGSIYAEAYFTVIAATGDDASTGLTRLTASQDAEAVDTPVILRTDGSPMTLFKTRPSLEEALQ